MISSSKLVRNFRPLHSEVVCVWGVLMNAVKCLHNCSLFYKTEVCGHFINQIYVFIPLQFP